MKSFLAHSASSLLLVLLCQLPVAAATLSVRADSWPPYNGDPGAVAPGYMIEVLQEIFSPQGVTIDYKVMPWKRAISDVQNGTFDAVVGSDPEETPGLIFPKENFGVNLNGLYVKAGTTWRFTGAESLSQVRLGAIDGYSYSGRVDDYLARNRGGKQVFLATGDDALDKLLKMLQSGRIDAIIENVNVMTYTLRGAGLENQVVSAGVNEQGRLPLYVAFSPRNTQAIIYARNFDEGIVRLRKSGRLKEILATYGLKDWK